MQPTFNELFADHPGFIVLYADIIDYLNIAARNTDAVRNMDNYQYIFHLAGNQTLFDMCLAIV